MSLQDKIYEQALNNYSEKGPWPNADEWHNKTYQYIYKFVTKQLIKYDSPNAIVLNAGSGGTDYPHKGKMIHLDIVEKYIKDYPDYIVAPIDSTTLKSESVDIIICVGSVINYADYQRSIKEFNRILKPNGILILEFERSNSAEFLFDKRHHKEIFSQAYYYNGQKHILWMYNEKNIMETLKLYGLTTIKKQRFHTVSTLLNRFGMYESTASKFIKADFLLNVFSYFLSHNCILVAKKSPKE